MIHMWLFMEVVFIKAKILEKLIWPLTDKQINNSQCIYAMDYSIYKMNTQQYNENHTQQ